MKNKVLLHLLAVKDFFKDCISSFNSYLYHAILNDFLYVIPEKPKNPVLSGYTPYAHIQTYFLNTLLALYISYLLSPGFENAQPWFSIIMITSSFIATAFILWLGKKIHFYRTKEIIGWNKLEFTFDCGYVNDLF